MTKFRNFLKNLFDTEERMSKFDEVMIILSVDLMG